MRVLCVAEKPSVARSIVNILSGGQFNTRNTSVNYIKNFDFSYRVNGRNGHTDFTVTSVSGHLTSSDFSDDYKKWGSRDAFQLFDAPIIHFVTKNDVCPGIERNLLQEARRADEVMIWTDCDREGEHIGSEVADVCRRSNPRIRVTRARFSAIIPAQIHRAANNTFPLDMNQVHAVQARMDLDLRIGAALTRIQTLKLQSAFPGHLEKVISYGPCQFPTLGFVVDRYNEVQNFVAETFWYIYVTLERDDFNVIFKWNRNHLFDHQAVLVLFEQCVNNPEARVMNVVTRPISKWKPLPLTTVELQKSGSRLLRMPPKRVLELAEGLYHRGLCSYPRTETDQFDPAFNFHELLERQRDSPAWGAFANMLLNDGGFERPRNGKKNDKAHPPIHPVQKADNLQGDEARVYEYIVRRFLAMCSKNATGAKTEVDIEIAEESFKASGLTVHQRNYLEVFPYDKWEGMHLPPFQAQEIFMPSVTEMREGQTTRPQLLTEADLVSLMDKNGIGTDATIAEHINTIITREYAMRQKQGGRDYLVPSTLGIGLVEGYNRIGFDKSLSKPHLRAETEQKMTMICAGQRTKMDVVAETIEEYKEVYMKTKQQFNTMIGAVREYLDGNAGQGNGPDNGHGNGGGGGHGGGGGGHHHGGNDDDDSEGDEGGPGGNGGGARGRGRGHGGAGGGRGGNASAGRGGAAATRGGRGGGNTGATGRRPIPKNEDNDENQGGPGAGGAPMCSCPAPAVERTVFKDGPNKGRQFWSCFKPKDTSCGFFEWADASTSGGNAGYGSNAGNNGRVLGKKRSAADLVGGSSIGSTPRCICDLVAVARICSNGGENDGRTFYSCSKVASTRCKFFEWAEEGTVPMTTNNGNSYGNSAKRHKPLTGMPMAAASGNGERSCYNCGDPNHFANACPAPKADGGSGSGSGECYNCQQTGHWSRDCPQKNAGGGGNGNGNGYGGNNRSYQSANNHNNVGAGSNYTCFRCGDPGHMANACTGGNGGGGGGYQPQPRSRGRGRGRGTTGTKRGRGSSSSKTRGSSSRSSRGSGASKRGTTAARGGKRGKSTSTKSRGGRPPQPARGWAGRELDPWISYTDDEQNGYDDEGEAGGYDYGDQEDQDDYY